MHPVGLRVKRDVKVYYCSLRVGKCRKTIWRPKINMSAGTEDHFFIFLLPELRFCAITPRL